MQVLIAFLVICFLIGGSSAGRRIRERPMLLLALSTVVAASFYSLRVVQ
ncbi:MAG: hypothetical protein QNJ12_18720 [Ilumatobacter sp.]|nr:hypothetical protein [Ilumatobacter sp.]MDJ0770834.1 hypothetical protein [Ilumatobacter sp.]